MPELRCPECGYRFHAKAAPEVLCPECQVSVARFRSRPKFERRSDSRQSAVPKWFIALTSHLVVAGCLSGFTCFTMWAATARKWIVYEPPDALCRVEVPYTPVPTEVPRASGSHGTFTYYWIGRPRTREELILAFFDLSRDPPAGNRKRVVDLAIGEFEGIRENSRVTGRNEIPNAAHPTWELSIDRDGSSHVMRVVLVSRRVYILWATAIENGKLSADAARFIDSFEVTKEK